MFGPNGAPRNSGVRAHRHESPLSPFRSSGCRTRTAACLPRHHRRRLEQQQCPLLATLSGKFRSALGRCRHHACRCFGVSSAVRASCVVGVAPARTPRAPHGRLQTRRKLISRRGSRRNGTGCVVGKARRGRVKWWLCRCAGDIELRQLDEQVLYPLCQLHMDKFEPVSSLPT